MLVSRIRKFKITLLIILSILALDYFFFYYFDILSLQYIIYNLILVTGSVYGIRNYSRLLRIGRFITMLFTGLFILEFMVACFGVFNISNTLNYLLITLFLTVINYFIFGIYLNFNPKNTKIYNWITLGMLFVIIVNPIYLNKVHVFPFFSVAFFCIYVIILCLVSCIQLMESPHYLVLWKNPLFLYTFANLLIYSVNFWSLTFRPVLYQLPLETLIRYRLLLFDLSTICMDIAYLILLYVLFLKPRNLALEKG